MPGINDSLRCASWLSWSDIDALMKPLAARTKAYNGIGPVYWIRRGCVV